MGDVIELRADPELERSCLTCTNARFGATTFCLVFGERIDDETGAAADCEVYEPDPEF